MLQMRMPIYGSNFYLFIVPSSSMKNDKQISNTIIYPCLMLQHLSTMLAAKRWGLCGARMNVVSSFWWASYGWTLLQAGLLLTVSCSRCAPSPSVSSFRTSSPPSPRAAASDMPRLETCPAGNKKWKNKSAMWCLIRITQDSN